MADPKRPPHETHRRELSFEAVLQLSRPHPPYGEHVIDDLTDDEAAAFLSAVLS